MRLVWTETALGHLEGISQYISRTSPVYAAQVLRRIVERSGQLAEFPQSGRMVSEYQRADVREVLEPPYRIIYQVAASHVNVLAVVHMRRADLGIQP